MVFAGVDRGFVPPIVCSRPARAPLLQQRIIHDVDGLRLLAERLNGFGVEMLVAIERAEGLLVEFMQTLPMLTLFCVSPKISAGPGPVPVVGVEVGHLRRVRVG
jgi:hypothetical protein